MKVAGITNKINSRSYLINKIKGRAHILKVCVYLPPINKMETIKKIRFVRTKGTEKDYEKFKSLFEKLGIKLRYVQELEVNLNFEE